MVLSASTGSGCPSRPSLRLPQTLGLSAAIHALLLVSPVALQVLGPRRAASRYRTIVQSEVYGNCPDMPDLPNNFTSSEIHLVGKQQMARATFKFRHDYQKFTKVVVFIKKCVGRNDPNCEPFQTWRFGGESCSLIAMKDMLWSPLFAFQPPLLCPLKTGEYHVENATVDLEKLKLIKFPEKGFYKVNVICEADKIPQILCFHYEGTFAKILA